MTGQPGLYNNVAPLRNVSAMLELVERVQNSEHGLPRFGCFSGFAGYGKSTAATFTANACDAIIVEAKDYWTRRSLCDTLAVELGLKPKGTVASLAEQIAEQLVRGDRPLIIDEADHLLKRDMLELVRGIHQSSGVGVIFVGLELFPQNLRKYEQVHSRMLGWVQAQPGNMADLQQLAKIWCPDVELEPDFLKLIFETSRQSIRRMSVGLANARTFAKTRGLTQLGRREWGAQVFENGEAPMPRRGAA